MNIDVTAILPLVWLALMWFALKNLRSSLQVVFENLIQKIILNREGNSLLHVGRGLMLSSLTFSSAIMTVFVTSMLNGGLVKILSALALLMGSQIGGAFYLVLGLVGLLPWAKILLIVSFVFLLFTYLHKKRHFFWFLFCVSLLAFAQESLSMHFQNVDVGAFGQWPLQSSAYSHFMVVMVAMTAAAFFRSSLLLSLFGLCFHIGGHISTDNLILLLMSAPLGEGIYSLFVSKLAVPTAKRVSYYNIALKLLNFLVALVFVDSLVQFFTPAEAAAQMILKLMALNFVINSTVVVVLLPTLNRVANFLEKLVPEQELKQSNNLKFFGPTELNLPTISLSQINLHLIKMKSVLDRMFKLTAQYVQEQDRHPRVLAKIKDYERIIDNMSAEALVFETYLAQKILTPVQASQLGLYDQVTGHMESVADYVDKLAILMTDVGNAIIEDKELLGEIYDYLRDVYSFYEVCTGPLGNEGSKNGHSLEEINEMSRELKANSQKLRMKVIHALSGKHVDEQSLLSWLDMVFALRKIRGHSFQICRTLRQI